MGLIYHKGLGALWMAVLCMEVYKFTCYFITHARVDWNQRAHMAVAQMARKSDDEDE
ncbi:hypothetical protein SARC_11200, partial [Sphaeroforma arctica JP610]